MAADLKNPFDDLGPYGVEYKKKNVRRGRAQEPQPRPHMIRQKTRSLMPRIRAAELKKLQ